MPIVEEIAREKLLYELEECIEYGAPGYFDDSAKARQRIADFESQVRADQREKDAGKCEKFRLECLKNAEGCKDEHLRGDYMERATTALWLRKSIRQSEPREGKEEGI